MYLFLKLIAESMQIILRKYTFDYKSDKNYLEQLPKDSG